MIVFQWVLISSSAVHEIAGLRGRLCRLMGDLSYPVYVIHYALIDLFARWNWHSRPTLLALGFAAMGLYGA